MAHTTSYLFGSLSLFADQIAQDGFDRCYVFGSLVNENGNFFTQKGPQKSDIDMLITFSVEAGKTFDTRYSSCLKILPPVAQLERSLQKALSRDYSNKKICSILPVTRYELYHNINEGQDIGFYRTAQFCLVPSFDSPMVSLCHGHDERYHVVHNELLLALKHAQAIRKEFLATAPDGTRSLGPFSDTDVMPKMLMRRAALISAWRKKETQQPTRTELINGFRFLQEELKVAHPLLSEVREIIDRRNLRRGNVPPITENHQLVLAEFLFDLAKVSIPLTLREQFDKMLQRDPTSL